jgi:hypothetical protein
MPGGEYDQFDEVVRPYMFLPFIQVRGGKDCVLTCASTRGVLFPPCCPSVWLLGILSCMQGCPACAQVVDCTSGPGGSQHGCAWCTSTDRH